MSWWKHGCEIILRFSSFRRWTEKVVRFTALVILILFSALALAAEGLPPAAPEGGTKPAPGNIPEKMEPPLHPSPIDPGIQHVPEERGDPRGAVKPPNLDPGISKNPDVAPPARKGGNLPGGGAPQKKPDVR